MQGSDSLLRTSVAQQGQSPLHAVLWQSWIHKDSECYIQTHLWAPSAAVCPSVPVCRHIFASRKLHTTMPLKRKKQLVGTGEPCALCGDRVSGSEGRCLFSAIQAYLYQTVPMPNSSTTSTCLSLLDGKVNFRGLTWDIRSCPPDTEDSKSLVVHGRCQAVIRREAAKV